MIIYAYFLINIKFLIWKFINFYEIHSIIKIARSITCFFFSSLVVHSARVAWLLGCIFTGQYEIWSAICFLGSWTRKSGSFPGDIFETPLNLQKLPPKKGIFYEFAIWVSRFGQELVNEVFLGRWSRIWGNFLWIINISRFSNENSH